MDVHTDTVFEATMILRLTRLRGFPSIFRHLTGITLALFDLMLPDLRLAFSAQRRRRLNRPDRQRAFGGGDDFDLDPDDFAAKVNADVVGKVVNLASRTAKFLEGNTLATIYPDDGGLFRSAAERAGEIADAYERCDYSGAMRTVMLLADRANKYVEEREPWKLRKDAARQDELQQVCSVSLNLFRQLVVYLAPVLPRLAEQTGALLNAPIRHWDDAQTPLTGTPVGKFEHMMTRVDPAKVEAMTEESKTPESTPAPAETASPWNDGPEPLANEPLTADHCTIDDFMKVDMRVARVLEAAPVEGADKLLRLTLSLGGDVRRNVFAGIKAAY
ncbi:MAG TPA: hypothetical protein VF170_11600, partial [Planctomycetaceae bacterium]